MYLNNHTTSILSSVIFLYSEGQIQNRQLCFLQVLILSRPLSMHLTYLRNIFTRSRHSKTTTALQLSEWEQTYIGAWDCETSTICMFFKSCFLSEQLCQILTQVIYLRFFLFQKRLSLLHVKEAKIKPATLDDQVKRLKKR